MPAIDPLRTFHEAGPKSSAGRERTGSCRGASAVKGTTAVGRASSPTMPRFTLYFLMLANMSLSSRLAFAFHLPSRPQGCIIPGQVSAHPSRVKNFRLHSAVYATSRLAYARYWSGSNKIMGVRA